MVPKPEAHAGNAQCPGTVAQGRPHRPSAQMVVEDPREEVQRLRAQVAELQHERATTEESRAKKARVLSAPVLDLTPLPGAGPCSA